MTLKEQLADAVRTYWRQTYPKEVVAFYSVKAGGGRAKVIMVMHPASDRDYDHVEFMWFPPDRELASPIRVLDLHEVLRCIQDTCLDDFE